MDIPLAVVHSHDLALLQLKKGGGVLLSVFGLPFVLGGTWLLAATLEWLPMADNPPSFALGLAGGTVFLLSGLGVMGGRAGFILDKRRQTVVRWWGVVLPWQRREFSLMGFHELTLTKVRQETSDSSDIAYAVCLEGPSQPLHLHDFRTYEKARALAERLAQFLSMPLADTSSGVKVVRAPDELHQSLRERRRRAGGRDEEVAKPAALTSRVAQTGSAVTIDMPPTGLTSRHLPMAVLLMFVWLMSVPGIAVCLAFAGHMVWFALGFCVSVFGIIPTVIVAVPMLSSARTRTVVLVSPQGLRVEKRGLFGTRVIEIPEGELKELHLHTPKPIPNLFGIRPPQHCLVAQSNTTTVTIERDCSRAEAEYLHALILKALVSEHDIDVP